MLPACALFGLLSLLCSMQAWGCVPVAFAAAWLPQRLFVSTNQFWLVVLDCSYSFSVPGAVLAWLVLLCTWHHVLSRAGRQYAAVNVRMFHVLRFAGVVECCPCWSLPLMHVRFGCTAGGCSLQPQLATRQSACVVVAYGRSRCVGALPAPLLCGWGRQTPQWDFSLAAVQWVFVRDSLLCRSVCMVWMLHRFLIFIPVAGRHALRCAGSHCH